MTTRPRSPGGMRADRFILTPGDGCVDAVCAEDLLPLGPGQREHAFFVGAARRVAGFLAEHQGVLELAQDGTKGGEVRIAGELGETLIHCRQGDEPVLIDLEMCPHQWIGAALRPAATA